MRASRLVSVLLLLQTRGRLTAGELAEELEVSVRTVYRDVEALSEAGVPIYAERGPRGGIRLVDGYRTRLTGLTEEEAKTLFLSGLPGPAAELGLGTVVAGARLKMLAALPPELRSRASRINQRFHLDAPGWFQASDSTPSLLTLSTAVWEDRRVTVQYRRGADRVVDRVLDPLGLVLKGGVWYAVARAAGQPRTYRVSRIASIELRDDHFERPDDFDLGTFWADSSAAYERSVERLEVVVRVRPDHLDALADTVGQMAMRGATHLPDADPDGWSRLRLRLEWPAEAHEQLLRLGSAVEVLEPEELRHRVVEAARGVLERYGLTRTVRPAGG
jgi:predicted DNA-binding transcriptional regulator YafY